jgi:hypothetical protein
MTHFDIEITNESFEFERWVGIIEPAIMLFEKCI